MSHPYVWFGYALVARADAMFDVAGMHVLDVGVDEKDRLVLTPVLDLVGLDSARPAGCSRSATAVGCTWCTTRPCFGRITVVRWLKRVWRCREPMCPRGTFSETSDLAPPRAVLSVRAVTWAADALTHDDTTVSALARHLGVDWHTCWDAIEVEATARVGKRERLQKVKDPRGG